jgi:hypothetical protein
MPPQIIIDPSNCGDPDSTISINVLPPSARRFGFVPDVTFLQPGDLILSYSRSFDLTGNLIVRAQSQAGFTEEHSRWTHAAVFLYEDFIVEAVPEAGVISRTLYEDIPGSVLRVRRRPNLDVVERYQIALCALRKQGMRYSRVAALRAGWRASNGLWNATWYPWVGRAIICSNILSDAFVEITRSSLRGCPVAEAVFPAHLSATDDLDDVTVPWLRLNP